MEDVNLSGIEIDISKIRWFIFNKKKLKNTKCYLKQMLRRFEL